MIKPPFAVGQRVRMSDYGYSVLHLTSEAAHQAAQDLKITSIDNLGYDREPIWAVEVDKPEINMFLLEAQMFKAF